MLRQACQFTIAVLIGGLIALAAQGQLQKATALGQVVRSSSATLGGIPAPSGGTVVSGDVVAAPKGGGALVQFSVGSQIELGEDSSVTLSGTPDHVLAKVDHGTVTVQSPVPGGVVVETGQCRVDPAGQGSVSFSVTAPPGAGATISAQHGALAATEINSGQHHALAEGDTWTCGGAAAQAREEGQPGAGEQAGQAPAPKPTKHSNTGLLVLLIGGGVAGGVGAALAGGKGGGGGAPASPSAP